MSLDYSVTLTAEQWSAVQACLSHSLVGIRGTNLGERAQEAMDGIDAGWMAALAADSSAFAEALAAERQVSA